MKVEFNLINQNKKIRFLNKKTQNNKNLNDITNCHKNDCPKNYFLGIKNISFTSNLNNQYDLENRIISNLDKKFAGYKNEKEDITKAFILPIKQSSSNVPGAILISGGPGCGKTRFANAVANEARCKLVEISPEQDTIMEIVADEMQEARKRYIDTKQRTIILFENADLYLNNNSENKIKLNVAYMKNMLEDCAELPNDYSRNASGVTFFFTTESPQKISPKLIKPDKINKAIALRTPEGENLSDIVKFYIKENDPDSLTIDENEIDFDKIEAILSPNEEGAYTNDIIKRIVNLSYDEYKNTQKPFEECILQNSLLIKRNISQKQLQKTQDSFSWLVDNNLLQKLNVSDEIMENIQDIIKNKQNETLLITSNHEPIENKNDTIIASLKACLSSHDSDLLQDITIDNKPLVDFWIKKEQGSDNLSHFTQRLKNMWLQNILADNQKTDALINSTIDYLENNNQIIQTATAAFNDILDNEEELDDEQKDILQKHINSEMFAKTVMNGVRQGDITSIELNTMNVLAQLSEEKNKLKNNAKENIFNNKTIDISALSKDADEADKSNVQYVLNLLNQKAQNQDSMELNELFNSFETAIQTGDSIQLQKTWNRLVKIAEEYFNSTVLDDITNRNIVLLDSINQNMQGETNRKIKSLINNPIFTIEQKEFISRYKDNSNFKMLINNPNINISQVIEELVFFEAGNRNLINENNLDVSDSEFNKIMSDKFHQLDSNNKDINIQGNKISSKLDTINDSIVDFSKSFDEYSNISLQLESQQLEELIEANKYLYSIDNNTSEIKQYTQGLMRAKLVELEKDKNYKDIVPEITKLLPKDEQTDLSDFLSKVDSIAKKEKNIKRRNTILKAAAIIAATAAMGVGIYYFGPSIVAHLASKLPAAAAAKSVASAAAGADLARRIGNSKFMNDVPFGHYSSDIKILQDEINDIRRENKHALNMASKGGSNASYWNNKAADLEKTLKDHERWLEKAKNILKDKVKI